MYHGQQSRRIDDINVRIPLAYADPVPEGWYPELQLGEFVPLERWYCSPLGRYTYVDPHSVILQGPVGDRWEIWEEKLSRFGTIVSIRYFGILATLSSASSWNFDLLRMLVVVSEYCADSKGLMTPEGLTRVL
jgi:hypothetical protein